MTRFVDEQATTMLPENWNKMSIKRRYTGANALPLEISTRLKFQSEGTNGVIILMLTVAVHIWRGGNVHHGTETR